MYDYIAFNDDYSLPEGFTDGSIHRYDSYLALGLFPGDYMLAIGAFNLNPEDAIFGFNNYSDNLPYSCNTDIDGNCLYVANYHHGDYQVTLTGDVTISAVPIPPAMWLFGSGLIGLIGICRRNKLLTRTI